jgi:3-hydroxybutyryl-CoA dehydrogenase
MATEIKNVAVLGGGLMGTGIAQVVAVGGYRVSVYDIAEAILAKSQGTVAKQLNGAVAKGRMIQEDAKNALERISFTIDLKTAVGDADYIIEAVPEILDLKKKILAEVDDLAKMTAVFASNTSELSIELLASATGRKDRVIGTHWFYPPHIMRLVEVVVTSSTSDETLKATLDFCGKIGKETVVCKDVPGFITSRAISALITECMRLYDEGVASFEDIDKAMRLGFNHPIGPFQLTDMSGVDVVFHSIDSLGKTYGNQRFKPSDRMPELIKAGNLGQKTGKGFYDYNKDK